jgi:hypothetical protein
MTLNEIIEVVRSGEKPEYDDLRYAVCALDALSTFDRMSFMRLARAEWEGKSQSTQTQWEDHFNRHKRAGDTPPKVYVGWNNDPDNPDFLARRRASMRALGAELATPSEGRKP